jgi:hypothetical protein
MGVTSPEKLIALARKRLSDPQLPDTETLRRCAEAVYSARIHGLLRQANANTRARGAIQIQAREYGDYRLLSPEYEDVSEARRAVERGRKALARVRRDVGRVLNRERKELPFCVAEALDDALAAVERELSRPALPTVARSEVPTENECALAALDRLLPGRGRWERIAALANVWGIAGARKGGPMDSDAMKARVMALRRRYNRGAVTSLSHFRRKI